MKEKSKSISKPMLFAIVQVVIVAAFIILEAYQLFRYGLSLQHGILLLLWLFCMFFVARNLHKTKKAIKAESMNSPAVTKKVTAAAKSDTVDKVE